MGCTRYIHIAFIVSVIEMSKACMYLRTFRNVEYHYILASVHLYYLRNNICDWIKDFRVVYLINKRVLYFTYISVINTTDLTIVMYSHDDSTTKTVKKGTYRLINRWVNGLFTRLQFYRDILSCRYDM